MNCDSVFDSDMMLAGAIRNAMAATNALVTIARESRDRIGSALLDSILDDLHQNDQKIADWVQHRKKFGGNLAGKEEAK